MAENTPTPGSAEAIQRTPDGTITDKTPTPVETPIKTTETPTPEPKPEPKAGETLLTEKKPEDKPPAGAPEAYADFKVPEGYTLDPEIAKEAGTMFKGMNLNQEQAQSLVDFYTAKVTAAVEAPFKLWGDTQKEWIGQIEKEYGPLDGAKVIEIKSTIAKVVDSLGPTLATPFREAMDITGAGNNPAFIKAFYALAKQLGEGTAVKGGSPSTEGQKDPQRAPKTAAEALYPNLSR